MKTQLFSLCIIGLFIACSTPKNNTQDTPQLPEYQANNPQILFYNILLSKKNKAEPIKVADRIISKGKLKEDYGINSPYGPYQLLCSFLDKDKNILKQTAVDNPLNRRYEYTDDDGQLNSKVMEKEEGKLSLRVQLSEGMHYLKIEEVVNQSELSELGMIQL